MITEETTSKAPSALSPLASRAALDAYFFEARAKILDLAAFLDRIGRGAGATSLEGEARLEKIGQALEVLQDRSGGRAERIQQVFSLGYDPAWERPQPRD